MGTKYNNRYIHNIRRGMVDFALWRAGYYQDSVPNNEPPHDFTYPISTRPLDKDAPSVVWINHCTFLVKYRALQILTDPIWSRRCSPLPFFGPKRTHPPARSLEDLGEIGIVLISHNHYDHLDEKTVLFLRDRHPKLIWCIPRGLSRWFQKRKITSLCEFSWWESHPLVVKGESVTIHSVPAQHHSGRGVFDTNRSLWMGFVVQFENKSAYFVGDTGYNPYDFKQIGEKFGSIDLSLCPIGTYLPHRFMKTVHCSPEDAVNIHIDVRSKLSVGMHWKTFRLSAEPINHPPYELYCQLQRRQLKPEEFLPLEPGVEINW